MVRLPINNYTSNLDKYITKCILKRKFDETFIDISENRETFFAAPPAKEAVDKIAHAMARVNGYTNERSTVHQSKVYDTVKCTGCLIEPIVHFGYQCIQCSDYDLCQKCEYDNLHSKHIMVRLPINNYNSSLDEYIAKCILRRTFDETSIDSSENRETFFAAELAKKTLEKLALAMAARMTKCFIGSMLGSTARIPAQTDTNAKYKEFTNDKFNASELADEPQSFEIITKLLDSKKQILNNFNDMFTKMLEFMDNEDEGGNNTVLLENLKAFANLSVSSYINNIDSDEKGWDKKKSMELKEIVEGPHKGDNQPKYNNLSTTEIGNTCSDSENDCIAEEDSIANTTAPASFNKENKPESNIPLNIEIENIVEKAKNASGSVDTDVATGEPEVPITSSSNPNNMDNGENSLEKEKPSEIKQINEDTHKETNKPKNEIETESIVIEFKNESTKSISEPLLSTASGSPITNSRNEDKRFLIVYHDDHKINTAIHAMINMGFENEDNRLTKLLESVNGNLPKAMELMSIESQNMKMCVCF